MLKANKVEELMSQGYSLQQALDTLLKEHKMDKAEKTTKWTYRGDLKCPLCGKYTKLYTSGKTMKLTCSRHGLFIKVEDGVWVSKS